VEPDSTHRGSLEGPIIYTKKEGEIVELTTTDQVTAALARMIYVHYREHNNKDPRAAPFAPLWAYDYAGIAVAYLGIESADIDAIKEDYK
jgi:hypothetical protein